jgi:hypothetical protein
VNWFIKMDLGCCYGFGLLLCNFLGSEKGFVGRFGELELVREIG